jgi:hypothetical protein
MEMNSSLDATVSGTRAWLYSHTEDTAALSPIQGQKIKSFNLPEDEKVISRENCAAHGHERWPPPTTHMPTALFHKLQGVCDKDVKRPGGDFHAARAMRDRHVIGSTERRDIGRV